MMSSAAEKISLHGRTLGLRTLGCLRTPLTLGLEKGFAYSLVATPMISPPTNTTKVILGTIFDWQCTRPYEESHSLAVKLRDIGISFGGFDIYGSGFTSKLTEELRIDFPPPSLALIEEAFSAAIPAQEHPRAMMLLHDLTNISFPEVNAPAGTAYVIDFGTLLSKVQETGYATRDFEALAELVSQCYEQREIAIQLQTPVNDIMGSFHQFMRVNDLAGAERACRILRYAALDPRDKKKFAEEISVAVHRKFKSRQIEKNDEKTIISAVNIYKTAASMHGADFFILKNLGITCFNARFFNNMYLQDAIDYLEAARSVDYHSDRIILSTLAKAYRFLGQYGIAVTYMEIVLRQRLTPEEWASFSAQRAYILDDWKRDSKSSKSDSAAVLNNAITYFVNSEYLYLNGNSDPNSFRLIFDTLYSYFKDKGIGRNLEPLLGTVVYLANIYLNSNKVSSVFELWNHMNEMGVTHDNLRKYLNWIKRRLDRLDEVEGNRYRLAGELLFRMSKYCRKIGNIAEADEFLKDARIVLENVEGGK